MRPSISWADLAGRRVGVWGLGVEGHASLRRLRTMGIDPVLVDDSPPPTETASGEGGARPGGSGQPKIGPILRTDSGGFEALRECDIVIKSPGISRYREDARSLVDDGVALVGGLGLWLESMPHDRVIAITGTKGKSTTASVLGHLLNRLGCPTLVAGNIGVVPFDPALDRTPSDTQYWVVETSSYQATDFMSSPDITVVTSLHPDHLDWHGDVAHYYDDKLSMCHQRGARLTIANGDSAELRDRADQLAPQIHWVTLDDAETHDWWTPLGLRGRQNRRNAEIARQCLVSLGHDEADDVEALTRAAEGYVGLDHRLQTVAVARGVEFVDDTLSTNVLPTLSAIDAFADRPTALIVGGFDRGIDYTSLAEAIAARTTPMLVLTLAPAGVRIGAALDDVTLAPLVEVEAADSLDDAVGRAVRWAPEGGVVLLSPAAPSFGHYHDYRARAAAFLAAIHRFTT
jgi:UDP-N-acetylmuramoylalanine--D-glutamate ligase